MDEAERAAKAARAKAMVHEVLSRTQTLCILTWCHIAQETSGKESWHSKVFAPLNLGHTQLPDPQPSSITTSFRSSCRRVYEPIASPQPQRIPCAYLQFRLNNEPEPPHPARTLSPRPQTPSIIAHARPRTPQPPVEDPTVQLRELIQTQQQTITLLVSEKASLAASLDRLEGVEAGER